MAQEKYGVEVDPSSQKTAEEGPLNECPKCGREVEMTNVPKCPECGTKAFEKQ
jgi:rubrerythrin